MSAPRALLTNALYPALVFFGSIFLFGGRLLPNPLQTPDSTGVLSTYSTAGGIDINNPFFQSLGPMAVPATHAIYQLQPGRLRPLTCRKNSKPPRGPSRFFAP
jgi:hypothetical protein